MFRKKTGLPARSLSDEVARFIYDHTPDAYCFIEQGKIVDCNAAMEKIMACSRDKLVGLRPEDISPAMQPNGMTSDEMGAMVTKQVRDSGFSRFEWTHKRLDGTSFVVLVTLLGATIDGRRMMISMWQDIGALVEARNAERELQARQATAAAALEDVVTRMGLALGALAAGDLSARLDAEFPESYEAMRRNFNSAALQLAQVLERVVGATSRMSAGLSDVVSASSDLATRTEQQATAVTRASSAVESIATSAAQVAAQTREVSTVAASARDEAESAGRIVEHAIGSMETIQRSSREVANVAAVIDDIAFQTNLLALNAAVEAARAGDAGRSFAVVAAEVRRLAQRSAEAARDVKALIGTAGEQVDSGVKHVNETAGALRTIVARIVHISDLVSEISKITSAQADDARAISASIVNIDHMTRSNAEMVEHTAELGAHLAALAEDLRGSVSQFQLTAVPDPVQRVA